MMKMLLILLVSMNQAMAGQFRDCAESDKCTYRDCAAQVVEEVGNNAMATCREVYFKGELQYHELKILQQRIDPETKKSTITGNTIRLK